MSLWSDSAAITSTLWVIATAAILLVRRPNLPVVNPATYLAGGRNFGPLIPGSANIISRNLTPDASGLPIGGDTFDQFVHTIRTGIDPDHLHPPCTGAPDANCIPAPFNGNLLQIMPWPNLRKLSNNDLRAIYEYLSTVPCVQGNYPGESAHRCG
jgi:hypothetical protein